MMTDYILKHIKRMPRPPQQRKKPFVEDHSGKEM